LLLEACHLYRHLASDKFLKFHQCPAALLYELWFGLAYPHLLKKDEIIHPLLAEFYSKFEGEVTDPNDFRLFKQILAHFYP
jgi:hypothetical protein